MADKPKDIDECIAAQDDEKQATLDKLREVIRVAAPDGAEGFGYGMPAFKLDGRALLWLAAWKHHYALYPLTDAFLRAQANDLTNYETAKGTIRLPADQPLPYDLVRNLVKTRAAELQQVGK